ncbi:hypothetical protein WMZ97_17195 [Lentibacillus sp. N15]|uniref:hypothetical protein n=1 Tax=Lentibacillus songyuanensis TaxID=3136161 RepID=UPI0031BA59CB
MKNTKNKKFTFADNFALYQLLLIPLGVALNYVAGQLAVLLKLPVFLDTIGTAFVSIIAGPWIGLITGVLNNVLLGITNPMTFMGIPVQAGIAITIGFLSQKKMLLKVGKFVVAAIILTIVTTALSLPGQVLVLGGVTGTGMDIVTGIIVKAGMPLWSAVAVTQLASNIFDKTISLIIGLLMALSLSPRVLSNFRNGYIYMEHKKEKKGSKRKR